MTNYDKGVLFEREGNTPIGPEVGRLVDNHTIEFVDGTRVAIEDGDYVDVIDRRAEDWPAESLRALHRGLVARTERRLRQLENEKT